MVELKEPSLCLISILYLVTELPFSVGRFQLKRVLKPNLAELNPSGALGGTAANIVKTSLYGPHPCLLNALTLN